jgi:hypothetical protein
VQLVKNGKRMPASFQDIDDGTLSFVRIINGIPQQRIHTRT